MVGRSAIVATLSKKLMDFDFRDPGLKSMLELVHGYLETRVDIIQSRKVISHDAADGAVLTGAGFHGGGDRHA